jgi:hypothetical protein
MAGGKARLPVGWKYSIPLLTCRSVIHALCQPGRRGDECPAPSAASQDHP